MMSAGVPPEENETLGKKASYNFESPENVKQLNFNQFDTAIRSPKAMAVKPAPAPIVYPDEDSSCCGPSGLCARLKGACPCCSRICYRKKTKIVIAALALALILLLIIILPLVLTLGTEDDHNRSAHHRQDAATTKEPDPSLINSTLPDDGNSTTDDGDLLWELTSVEPEPDSNATQANTTESTQPTPSSPSTQAPSSPSTQAPSTATEPDLRTDNTTARPTFTPPPPKISLPASSTDTTASPTTASSTPPSSSPSPSPSPSPSTAAPPNTTSSGLTSSTKAPRLFPPVANCTGHDLVCADGQKSIGEAQLCDGVEHCPDGSDEAECTECKTSFSCPTADNQFRHCLRGSIFCDGKDDCLNRVDETIYCKQNCDSSTEYKCVGQNVCIPLSWMCDGDPQCPQGDDEGACSSQMCHRERGVRWCAADRLCLASWTWCDGRQDCTDGSDEETCDCGSCAGNDAVLCAAPEGRCVRRHHLCDGTADCLDGSDEINCPGWCDPERRLETVLCADGRHYPKHWACSGTIAQCKGRCNVCDPELAFDCGENVCIPRSQICDGKQQCADASDEVAELCGCSDPQQFECPNQPDTETGTSVRKCIPNKFVCDGYHDCADGADERDCSECVNNPAAVHCPSSRTCFPSTSRCDGEPDCPDFSDEDNCSCADCRSQTYGTYLCQTGDRCLKRDYVCRAQPGFGCQQDADIDRLFCSADFDPLAPAP